MRFKKNKFALHRTGVAASLLLLASGAVMAQQQVNLTAGPASAMLPDGSALPMWGYSCQPLPQGVNSTATCAALNLKAGSGAWSPVVITIPYGQDLQINLTNSLTFTTSGAPNNIPTSIVIVGQLGGGLGSAPTRTTSPAHAQQGVTWATVNSAGTGNPTFPPPQQNDRVQSFSTEVAAGATTSLVWKAPRPGTYLIESGTHPSIQGPMGLYGVLVVTSPPGTSTGACAATAQGTAYSNVCYDAEIPLLLSEIDPLQNTAVDTAVRMSNFSETASIALRDTLSAVVVASDTNGNPYGGCGYSVGDPVNIQNGGFTTQATAQVAAVTTTPTTIATLPSGTMICPAGAITAVTSTPGAGYSSIPLAIASSPGGGSGAQLLARLSLAGAVCSSGVPACYPAAVNYTPLYYLINGVAFDKTNAPASLFGVNPQPMRPLVTGQPPDQVLVRLVNAGLRMHVPSVVGALTGSTAAPGFSLIAEDGNPLPGIAHVQNEVFMAAGKTYDVMLTPTGGVTLITVQGGGAGYDTAARVVFSGGGGSGASANAFVTFSLLGSSLAVSSGGTGYSVGDALTLTGGGSSAATLVPATATVTAITQSLLASSVTISGGTGYTQNEVVTLQGGGNTSATATVTAVDSSGAITAFTVASTGTSAGAGYTAAPNGAPVVPVAGGSGSGAVFSASLDPSSGVVTAASMSFVGGGYTLTSLPTGTTDATNPAASGAVLTATIDPATGTVSSIVVVQSGSGYSTAPQVSISDAGATVTASARLSATVTAAGTLPVYDRQLSLSGNATERDAGMLAYIGLSAASTPGTGGAGAGGGGGGGGGGGSGTSVLGAATANADAYHSVVPGQTLTISDPSKGVIANDTNVYGVKVTSPPANGSVSLNTSGTFAYKPNAASWSSCTSTATACDSFTYCGNGTTTGAACAVVSLYLGSIEGSSGITVNNTSYTSTMATYLAVKTPGVLSVDHDKMGLPLTVATTTVTPSAGLTVYADANGGFTASAAGPGTYTFTYQAQNSQGTLSAGTASACTAMPLPTGCATVTLTFPPGSGLTVNVVDGYDHTTPITDYRWVIEEDRTFYIDPTKITNNGTSIVPTFGVNFHTSYMPFVAQGCTGPLSCESGQTVQGVPTVCDVSNGVCRTTDNQGNALTPTSSKTPVMPSQVALDPKKRYYLSILPGDAANPFAAGYGGTPDCTTAGHCGHGMGGAPIGIDPNTGVQQSTVQVLTQPSPYPTAKLSVFVFEDDFPLNGERDGGGGIDVLSPQEPGLGGFQIHLWDAMGGNGDFTGQMTYDMFNQPLTNSLDGTIDPATQEDACPITATGKANPGTNATNGPLGPDGTAQTTGGITGMIVTCPKYEADGTTLSPLAGQAVVSNLMPGRWGVVATPAADRIARGEEWLQTNTLDGQKAHDSFTRIGEPSYFQEFGPAGYHVSIGFANPAIINARKPYICNGSDPNSPQPGTPYTCGNTITGRVVGEHLSRTPDERLYGSGSHDAFYWTQCYVSFGDPDGEDFAFTKCNADGTFTLSGLPDGDWRITTFDQWNDQLVDGLSTPVRLGIATNIKCNGGVGSTTGTCNVGDIATTQWQANLYTRTFIDDNKDGLSSSDEAGIPFANVAVRLRDGSLENLLVTDFTGTANFNETFPLFAWYTVETDVTRYKNTGTHVVYDVGGPTDGSPSCGTTGYPPCGTSTIGKFLANTAEQVSVPTSLRVPGAVYCATADCTGKSIQNGPGTSDTPSVCTTTNGATTCTTQLSSGRIDPPWVGVEGWQGFPGQNNFLEFGKEPYVDGENGGIKGHVIYASTRPFDDPQMLVQTQWEPLVPNVTINLYQEGVAADGVTPTLTLVDHTQTSSWDDWAQGFHLAADGVTKIPNMNCPGQGAATGPDPDLFFFSLYNQPNYLDAYQHGTPTPLPASSQFKCYDGMHNWNQLQPAPYDGMYQFPSVTSVDPTTGKPNATNCTICQAKGTAVATGLPTSDLYYGLPQLPPGKYVVEVVVPPGFELVKEEDKNILIGDNFIAPAAQQIGGLGNVFILPDQASLAAATTNPDGSPYNPQNPTQGFGANPNNGIVPSFVPEPTWPCAGELRTVPDYISLYPQTHQVAPFAGANRRLCDRKEVTLGDQMGAIAKFYVYTSTHIASKFTGGITDDYTSEFDPFSPQFGEKFAPPDLPISVKDWSGNEISRVYADHWGAYNGMTYSTWEVNPPNPTGYSPTMMVFCMNDPGPIKDTRPGSATLGQMITDPLFTQGYSQFCYELPFMPGTTQYLDTPVVPTSAFAGAGYNNADCNYPDATPAVASVLNTNPENNTDGTATSLPALTGPWVAGAGTGHQLTINALGDQIVPNNAYSGPSATKAPYNQKSITRHYGFGAQCTTPTAGSPTCNTLSTVAIGTTSTGAPLLATINSWGDQTIVVTVPPGVTNCPVQQQAQYGGSTAQCGQLVITAGNGKQSIDAVTVTVGGKTPTVLAANASSNPMTPTATGALQGAIDSAMPGDMIIVPPGSYQEMLLMWKPVRLQGVGAASSILNANTQPAGKLDPWRRQVNCLFGLALNGQPINPSPSGTIVPGNPSPNAYDPTNTYSCSAAMYFAVDRLPTEATINWDATLNGNLAELLQEPSLMGALEGAGITVLGKGMNFPVGTDPFGIGNQAAFPTGTVLLGTADCTTGPNGANPNPSNFQCNPSGIDGLGITNSSQGGGGIFVHAWGHNLQIANNRISNNAGTLSGGINVGQGEFPPQYIQGSAIALPPGSCLTSPTAGVQLPYCHDLHVNVHNNDITLNSSTGDELFSATPAGAGGVSFCTGADYYKFNYNFVCGNLSSGDGGGIGHMGFSYGGDIEHNTIVFNQSINPTIPANGGGIIVMGAPDVDPTCGTLTDQDCVSPPGSIGPSDGVGPGLVINANLIQGNAAESGSGGGIAFQNVNGSEVIAFPTAPAQWYGVKVTNNIIVDNVAGWDGAGISLLDALNVDIVNNTIANNSTTASAGPLFNTLGAPLASTQGPTCTANCGSTSAPQPAGLVSIQNSAVLAANMAAQASTVCPANHYAPGTAAANGTCAHISYPLLANNIVWHNSAYYIGVGALSNLYQQNIVSLYNAFSGTPAASQPSTGACTPGASYWDIGVRGDSSPSVHTSTYQLAPHWSVLTDAGDYGGMNNIGTNPNFVSGYCDGSRQPPEAGISGWQVPPGIADATVPNPAFNLTPVATVDEGNNWVNMRWGPLSIVNPVDGKTILANYDLQLGSTSIDHIPDNVALYGVQPFAANGVAPTTDFFGNARPDATGNFDIGAIETTTGLTAVPPMVTSITPNSGVRQVTGSPPLGVVIAGSNLSGATAVTFAGTGVTAAITSASPTEITANVTITPAAALTTRNLTVTTPGGPTTLTNAFTVLGPTLSSITPTSGLRGVSVPVVLTGTGLTSATSITVAGTGFTVTAMNVVNDTTINATFQIGNAATLGAHNVSVVTGIGTTNTVAFAVNGPTLTSITPTSGQRGMTNVPVTLTGTNLTGASAITVSGAGVTVSGLTVVNSTTVTANFAIAPTAGLTVRTVSVTTPIGTTNTVTFTVVNPPAATLTSISPPSGVRGTAVPVTLMGTNFTPTGTTVAVSGANVAVTGVTIVSPTQINATFTIAGGITAALGARNVTVTTPAGTTPPVTFSVLGPTVTSIAPPSGLHNTAVNVTLTGTNLSGATAVTVSGTLVTASNVVAVNAMTVTATFNIGNLAARTARSITVTTPIGVTPALAGAFTVN